MLIGENIISKEVLGYLSMRMLVIIDQGGIYTSAAELKV